MKWCRKCNKQKDNIEFNDHGRTCTQCRIEYEKEYQRDRYEEKRLETLKRKRDHTKLHPFKSMARNANLHLKRHEIGHRVTEFDLYKIAKKQKLICPISGVKLTRKNISLDHIIPTAKGGLNVPENVQLVDLRVNKMKLDSTEKEFFEWIERIYNYQTRKMSS